MNVRFLALGLMLPACGGLIRAQDQGAAEAPILDTDTSPYHRALLQYKAGNFEEAQAAFSGSDPAKWDDRSAILDSRILTELKRYEEAEKILTPRLQGAHAVEMQSALGDVLLARHSFTRAGKYYAAALQARPNDADLILKSVYADVGAGDLVSAGQLASQLTPLDPKHPYDDHATYYFAQAALAEATGKDADAQDQIQAARTNYGVQVTNRYLRTYLKVFASPAGTDAMRPTPQKPTPATPAAPTGAAK